MSNNILDDKCYQRFILYEGQNLKESTLKKYNQVIGKFTNLVDTSFSDIVTTALKEQENDNYNPNKRTSTIYKVLNLYVVRCEVHNVKNSSINTNINIIRRVLNALNVDLPYWEPLPLATDIPLSKKEIQIILNSCEIRYKSLLMFILTTKIPINICLDMKVEDFRIATYNSHHCKNVPEMLDNFKVPTIGTWIYNDKEGRKIGFNTIESTAYILEELKGRKDVSSEDYLFAAEDSKSKLKITNFEKLITRKTQYLFDLRVKSFTDDLMKLPSYLIKFNEDYEKDLKIAMKNKKSKFSINALNNYYNAILHKHCIEKESYDLLKHKTTLDNEEIINKLKKYYTKMTKDLSLDKDLTPIFDCNQVNNDLEEYFKNINNNAPDKEFNIYCKERFKLHCKKRCNNGYYLKKYLNYYDSEINYSRELEEIEYIQDKLDDIINDLELELGDIYKNTTELKQALWLEYPEDAFSGEEYWINLVVNLLQLRFLEKLMNKNNEKLKTKEKIIIQANIYHETNKEVICLDKLLDILVKVLDLESKPYLNRKFHFNDYYNLMKLSKKYC